MLSEVSPRSVMIIHPGCILAMSSTHCLVMAWADVKMMLGFLCMSGKPSRTLCAIRVA